MREIVKQILEGRDVRSLLLFEDINPNILPDIISDVKDERRSLLKKYPALPSDEATIKAAKLVAKKYKVRYQDILKNFTPSNSIIGSKSWDENGNIITVR